MKVGVNSALRASGGGYRQTGISRYLTEMTEALRQTMQPDDELIELGLRLGPLGQHASARILWEQSLLAADVLRHRLDVFHGPVNALPLAIRAPTVVTIHDLAFLRYPEHVTTRRRAWLASSIRFSARTADRIIAVSQHTADDLRMWLLIDPSRIEVIPMAVSSRIRRLEGSELQVFQLKFDIDRPFVLAVGTLEPRKNLPMLIQAFAAIKDQVPHRLVLVGPEGWLTDDLRQTVVDLRLGDRLVMTGFVDDEALGGWYSAADLVVVPSLYEGFGLPLLEAMSCSTPVLASNVSSLPEVGGDAARYLDPGDRQSWSEAMLELLGDDDLRARLVPAGLARAGRFSWRESARATWKVYREVAR